MNVVLVKVRRLKGMHRRELWPIFRNRWPSLQVADWLWKWQGPSGRDDFVFAGRKGHVSSALVRQVVKSVVHLSGEQVKDYLLHSLCRGGAQLLELLGGLLDDLRAFGGWMGDRSPFEYLGTQMGAKICAARKLASCRCVRLLSCLCCAGFGCGGTGAGSSMGGQAKTVINSL